jgi:hypothetical protein
VAEVRRDAERLSPEQEKERNHEADERARDVPRQRSGERFEHASAEKIAPRAALACWQRRKTPCALGFLPDSRWMSFSILRVRVERRYLEGEMAATGLFYAIVVIWALS